MKKFSDMPIRKKLTLIIMATSVAIIILVVSAIFINEIATYRQATIKRLVSLSEITALNSTAALTFDDAKAAQETLSSFRIDTDINYALITAIDGTLFAEYYNTNSNTQTSNYNINNIRELTSNICNQSLSVNNILILCDEIYLEDELLGHLYIFYNMDNWHNQIIYEGKIILLTLFIAIIASYIISSAISRIISRPITNLSDAMTKISNFKDYSLRVNNESSDEIGALTENFNDMLRQIEERDKQITLNRDNLKQDVIDGIRKLEEKNTQFEVLVENAADGIFIHDSQGKFYKFNKVAQNNLGYSNDDIETITIFDIDTGVSRDQLLPILDKLDLGETASFEGIHKRKDGSTFAVDVKTTAYSIVNDTKFFVAIARDISERKNFEEQLLQEKHNAENANKAKSLFLSSMSHELRTPMNAILGFAQLLQSDKSQPITADQAISVEHILKGGRHLLSLINEILDLAKIESGKFDISVESIDPTQAIDDCLSLAQSLATNYEVTVQNKSSGKHLHHILADPLRLKQIILNLLSNAIKYNNKRGNVELDCHITNYNTMRIEVKDDGPGIDEQHLKHLYTPFNRLGVESGQIEGSGIGLTISKKLIEIMNGQISCKSTVGKGTTFSIELPLASSTEHNAHIETKPESPPIDFSSPNTNMEPQRTILYIEDNPANMNLMIKIFEHIPEVMLITADNAEHGLDIANQEHPDLILMDINLPGMNGIDAQKILKQTSTTAKIPVVAVTANAMFSDVKKANKLGFSAYITKPFNISEIINTVRNELQL